MSLQSGQTAKAGKVACVNPAALAGGAGDLDPYLLAATQTPQLPIPGLRATPDRVYADAADQRKRAPGWLCWAHIGRGVAGDPQRSVHVAAVGLWSMGLIPARATMLSPHSRRAI